jgi:hypothetical protein
VKLSEIEAKDAARTLAALVVEGLPAQRSA